MLLQPGYQIYVGENYMQIEKTDTTKTNKVLRYNPKLAAKRLSKKVLRGHYLWCKEQGRDTSWYVRQK